MLTEAQLAAGRAFRDDCEARLAWLSECDPPVAACSPFGPPCQRHECAKHPGSTQALPLRSRHQDSDDGLFRFTWLEGRCHHCRASIRSSSGYISVLEKAG